MDQFEEHLELIFKKKLANLRSIFKDLRKARKIMSKIQLHKSIQHITTINGKLSDKTIKLINIMAKKAYGSK